MDVRYAKVVIRGPRRAVTGWVREGVWYRVVFPHGPRSPRLLPVPVKHR